MTLTFGNCTEELNNRLFETVKQYMTDIDAENKSLKSTIQELKQKLEQKEYNKRYTNTKFKKPVVITNAEYQKAIASDLKRIKKNV